MARGWDTQEKARAEIERLTGWRIPQSVYAEWESGRRLPADANLERLRAFYGDAPETTETPDSLVAALRDQTAAIDRQTTRIGDLVTVIQQLLGIEDRPATSGTRRTVAQNFLRTLLDEAEASGSAEGDRRAQEPEDPERPAPSPARRTRGIGAGRG